MDKFTEKDILEFLNMRKSDKKKRNFSKLIIVSIILLNIVFTASVLYVFLKTGNEPMALVGAWFSFTTGELWLLSKIKRDKVEVEYGKDRLETEIIE